MYFIYAGTNATSHPTLHPTYALTLPPPPFLIPPLNFYSVILAVYFILISLRNIFLML